MPTFLCTKCGAIENSATSNYWCALLDNKPPICSKCETGIWHNRFPRQHWSSIGVSELLAEQKRGDGSFVNAKEHLQNIGVIGSKKNTVKEIPWED